MTEWYVDLLVHHHDQNIPFQQTNMKRETAGGLKLPSVSTGLAACKGDARPTLGKLANIKTRGPPPNIPKTSSNRTNLASSGEDCYSNKRLWQSASHPPQEKLGLYAEAPGQALFMPLEARITSPAHHLLSPTTCAMGPERLTLQF